VFSASVFLVPAVRRSCGRCTAVVCFLFQPLGGAVIGVHRRSVFLVPAARRRYDRFSAPFCGSPTRNHIYRAKKACSVFLFPAARRSYGRCSTPFCGSLRQNHTYRAKKACSVFLVPAARRSCGYVFQRLFVKILAESDISC
jgi:hypothetical protein